MVLPIVHHPHFDAASVDDAHRFPMRKFARLAEVLLEDGLVEPGGFHEPIAAPESWLELAHTPKYVSDILTRTLEPKAQRRIGFEITEAVANRSRRAVSGTVLTARLALEHGIACNTAGGSHHAHADFGAGFCVFNDVAVAAKLLLAEGSVSTVLVFDCDVHQGDGTARIFEHDQSVFTVSVHCEDNWPVRKATSDMDVNLKAGSADRDYLAALTNALDTILSQQSPDLVFYNAGVDPHKDDRLGKLCLTDQGIAERDHLVLSRFRDAGIPVAGILGGGYGTDIDRIAWLHASLHRTAAALI